jgi:hypothetical protein
MIAARFVLTVLALVLAGACAPVPLPSSLTPAPIEPPAAAAFIAAHTVPGAVLPGTVSPLYAAESTRRGRGAGALDGLWREAAPRLRFALIAAQTDGGQGLAYALYLARPRGRAEPITVWRIDLDAGGRVIWGEAVRLLHGPVRVVRLADRVGVVADDGEGYLVVTQPGGRGVRFVTLYGDGSSVDDPWSFVRDLRLEDGRDVPPLSPTDPALDADLRRLLVDYLVALDPPRVRT